MKALIIVFLLACMSYISALWTGDSFSHTDGRPGCLTPIEQGIKWRNNFDNVRYWVCTGSGADSYICPPEYLFYYERQCCIRWNFWVWSTPFDPPSLA